MSKIADAAARSWDLGNGLGIKSDLDVRGALEALTGYGLEIVDRVPLEAVPNPGNARYLRTKAEKLGHLLSIPEEPT